jgi:hypothetical protein
LKNVDGNILFYCYTGIYDGDELIGGIILENKKDNPRRIDESRIINLCLLP